MPPPATPKRTRRSTLRALVKIGGVPTSRLILSTGLGVAAALSTVALMASSGALIDKAALRPPLYTLTVLMAAVQIFALCRGPLRYAERIVSHDAALRVLGRLRLWVFDQIAPRTPACLRHRRDGDLLASATGDVQRLQDLYVRGISPLIVAVATSVFAVVLLAVVLPLAGLVVGCGLGGALTVTTTLAWVRHNRLGATEAALRGELAADIVELLQGAPDLLAFGLEETYLDRALAGDAALTQLARRRAWTAGAINGMAALFLGATVVACLAVAVDAVHFHHIPGFMVAVLPLVAMSAFEVVAPAADAVAKLSEHVEAAGRLLAIADIPIPVTDPPVPAPTSGGREIRLDDARLRYGADYPWVLDGLSLEVPPGGRVALVGASGAGKSSVAGVLLRFWELQSGTASLGGTDLTDLHQDVTRQMIGWVAQDTHLFNTTIRGNIAMANPDASDASVLAAADMAQLGLWIDTLPRGLETPVGEMGSQLSGGQRQRIALARALLADTPILVLDEPTSGLDRPTAERLLHDVLASASSKSILYITHRMEELSRFTNVVTIEGGHARTVPAVTGPHVKHA